MLGTPKYFTEKIIQTHHINCHTNYHFLKPLNCSNENIILLLNSICLYLIFFPMAGILKSTSKVRVWIKSKSYRYTQMLDSICGKDSIQEEG